MLTEIRAMSLVLATITLATPGAASTVVSLTGDQVSGIGAKTGVFDNGTVSGTVEAFVAGPCGLFCDPVLVQDPMEGLGIARNGRDAPGIDAIQPEAMTFVFAQDVIFEAIDFGSVDADDDWSVTVDGITLTDLNQQDPFVAFSDTPGRTLTISAFFEIPEDLIFLEADDFMVQSLTVRLPGDSPTIVPLPASAGLLLAGLGGLLVLRHRSRSRARSLRTQHAV